VKESGTFNAEGKSWMVKSVRAGADGVRCSMRIIGNLPLG
jgi:hypothetical protein